MKQVVASISDIMDQSERAARAHTLSIPDGVYQAESYMDDDGVSISDRIPIRVRVTVEGDEMTVDLSEVAAQVKGFLQFRHHYRPRVFAGGLQVHHVADRLPDQ